MGIPKARYHLEMIELIPGNPLNKSLTNWILPVFEQTIKKCSGNIFDSDILSSLSVAKSATQKRKDSVTHLSSSASY